MVRLYNSSFQFRLNANRMAALACSLLDELPVTIDQLYDKISCQEDDEYRHDSLDLALFFFCIELDQVKKQRGSHFPIATWNQRSNALNSSPRTNNRIEGWHRDFIDNASTVNSILCDFVEIRKWDMDSSWIKIVQLSAGHNTPAQRPAYVELLNRIKNIVSSNRTNLQKISDISRLYKFDPLI